MSELEKFRQDFALVWKQWIAQHEETAGSYQEAGRAVKKNMSNIEWMAAAAAHFAQLADAIRRDLARSERIREEMRAARAMIDIEDGMRGVMG